MVEMGVVRARLLAWTAAGAALVMAALACLPDLAVSTPTKSCGNGLVDLPLGEACDPGPDAAVMGCTGTCQVDCDGGALDPQTGHCYFWTDPADSIDRAMLNCSLEGAHLVSFVDLQELQLVVTKSKSLPGAPDGGNGSWVALEKGAINDAGAQTYYIPPGVPLEVPAWASTCPGCFGIADGGDADFPLSGTNPQLCVFWKRSTSASWVQQVCNFNAGTNVAVLCEREPVGAYSAPCTDDAAAGNTCIRVPRTAATKRYELTANAASFDNARAECAARGGMLAKFESAAEREEVMQEVGRELAGGDVWIGLVFDADAGAWTWLDGTPAPAAFPTPWADTEPSVNAGAASMHIEIGRYDTRLARAQGDTTTTFRAICQFPK